VITLGQEALDAVRAVADDVGGVQTRLAPDGYACMGTLTVGDRRFKFLPLVHPGLIRQQKKGSVWRAAVDKWKAAL